MRKLPLLLLLTTLTAYAAPKPRLSAALGFQSGGNPTTIAFTWSYTPTPDVPNCSTTVTTNCFSGFQLTDTTTGTVIATSTTLLQTTTSYNYTPSGGLYFGTHTFSLVATGVGATTGTTITSSAATTSVTNALTALNAPTGFTGTP